MTTHLINHSKISMPRNYIFKVVKIATRILRATGHRLDLQGKELVIVFVDRSRGKELNTQFRSKTYPTDILSFAGEGELLGELAICAPVVKKQAKEHKLTFREECAYLIIHGILHLLDYEHEKNKKQAQEMFSLQDKIFDKVLNQTKS